MKEKKIPAIFIRKAADVIADTNEGISTSKVASICSSYAIDYDVEIPYSALPFESAHSKRDALYENLICFSSTQQYKIIKDLCELEGQKDRKEVKQIKLLLVGRYSEFDEDSCEFDEVLSSEVKHWLNISPSALAQYESAITKYKQGLFKRNLLDDLRLSLELLLKDIFQNEKSLENQKKEIKELSDTSGGSVEFRNMFQKLVEYYTKYQNEHVKHDSNIVQVEIEFIMDITACFMKTLIRMKSAKE